MIFVNEYTSIWIIVVNIIILGIGSGLFQSPNNLLVMRSVPSGRLGIGGSMNALSRNIGNNVGLALTTIILYNSISSVVGYHTTSYVKDCPEAFIAGMKNTFVFASIVIILAIVLAAKRYLKKSPH
jgi:MFS family permease